jgi:ubiquinone/menaquinone biosynthesis C-methylase UbiE
MSQPHSTDFEAITSAQRESWAAGDFHQIARQNVCMAEALCEAVDPHAGERVLDIGCGSGTAALVAARRYSEVAGIDYVPALIGRAKARAAADDLAVAFRVGDAQALPFPDKSFDVVISVYGAQFAPDQERTAAEMLRVCRPGGRIGLATPVPDGWSGDFFAINAKYRPLPPGVRPPLRWGTEAGLAELLGGKTCAIDSTKKIALQYYRSVAHAVQLFMTCFGPIVRASDKADKEIMQADLEALFNRYNRSTDGTAVIENTYLQTTAIRA